MVRNGNRLEPLEQIVVQVRGVQIEGECSLWFVAEFILKVQIIRVQIENFGNLASKIIPEDCG